MLHACEIELCMNNIGLLYNFNENTVTWGLVLLVHAILTSLS